MSGIDDHAGGLAKGKLSVLVGPSQVGKTALALQIALCASSKGVKTLYVSRRETARELASRLLALQDGIDRQQLERQPIGAGPFLDVLRVACGRIEDYPLSIWDAAALSRKDLLDALAGQRDLGLIVLDQTDGRGRRRRAGPSKEALQGVAEDTGAAVLALAWAGTRRASAFPRARWLKPGFRGYPADLVLALARTEKDFKTLRLNLWGNRFPTGEVRLKSTPSGRLE